MRLGCGPRALAGFTLLLACAQLATADGSASARAAGAQPAGSPPAGAPASIPARPDRALSNERTLTTWAHPLAPARIFAQPDAHARSVGRIHMETEDGFAEVYLLLSSRTDAGGVQWVKLRLPGRPNGRTGWVPRTALGAMQQTHWLILVSLSRRRLYSYLDGRLLQSVPVGVGEPASPTPAGRFWVRERFKLADRSNPYWPYALGTSAYSRLTDWPGGGVVGIHGDFGEPQSIPGDPSHGCVRMRDSDIAWLAPRITLGTPVHIVR